MVDVEVKCSSFSISENTERGPPVFNDTSRGLFPPDGWGNPKVSLHKVTAGGTGTTGEGCNDHY